MENGFTAQTLSHPALVLAGLPDALRMQLGPFNPQVQDVKGINSLHSLNASAFRLRYANNYPAFPAHLIHHLHPQLFPSAVDPRSVHFNVGAFRPFNLSASPKLFPSAFAPPHKPDSHIVETGQDLSPSSYVPKLYDNDDESNFRSQNEREMDLPSSDLSGKTDSLRASTPGSSPKTGVKEEKGETSVGGKGYEVISNVESDASSASTLDDDRGVRRQKVQFDPTCCPICGLIVLLGEAESHFFKEVERLAQMSSTISRERKYIFEKIHPSFGNFASAYVEENGHSSEGGLPRGRWETYQRIKSNRLSRLRIKNRRRKSGEIPLCPVCNEKMEGTVEDINLHVEHCLKKHSEVEEEEDENIDVEGDSEAYGDYEWGGSNVVRATTYLVGGLSAGLLTTANSMNHQKADKDDETIAVDGDDSSTLTPNQLSDGDVNMDDDSLRSGQASSSEQDLPKTTLRNVINGK